jgi:hypothetical protein
VSERPWLSVTQVLKLAGLSPDYSSVDPEVLERARAIGVATAKGIELLIQGRLDPSSVHPEIAPRLSAARRFLEDFHVSPELVEAEIRSERWGVLGHPDLVGILGAPSGPVRAIVDWKCIESPSAEHVAYFRRQVCGGYGQLWESEEPKRPVGRYLAVCLRSDGSYEVFELRRSKDCDNLFRAAILVARAKRGEIDG